MRPPEFAHFDRLPLVRPLRGERTDLTARESAMPERGQSRVDAGIIAVVAVTTGAFVALTGHGLVAALATVVGLALGMAIVRYLIKGR
ncbi:hypothetical protein [Rhodococcus erythropolis]|uniref:hypothetical protein n=2 Tax=Nocardiaceae TaxID=85025 RepID=UPI001F1F70F5|nr:hypothetical protein [Rhodococcus erythropolis]